MSQSEPRTLCSERRPHPHTSALPYTSSPWGLLRSDIGLLLAKALLLPGIIFPIKSTHELDELYPSKENLYDIALHALLFICQSVFLIAVALCLVFSVFVNLGIFVMFVAAFLLVNHLFCRLLNGPEPFFESDIELEVGLDHSDERWLFLNGVAVGGGIIFDVIQCLVQRDLNYVTEDIRAAYSKVKEALYDEKYKKVVFVLHSQGGIEGGMIVDWLLDEVPQVLLEQLEVYTFGCAANHFNNPPCRPQQSGRHGRLTTAAESYPNSAIQVLGHVEHYANSGDFVSQWGVLHFTGSNSRGYASDRIQRNRFVGKVFERPGSGHQFNQHYLNNMFTLDGNGRVAENNKFMDMRVENRSRRGEEVQSVNGDGDSPVVEFSEAGSPIGRALRKNLWHKTTDTSTGLRVRDISRLWLYRNGLSPATTNKVAR